MVPSIAALSLNHFQFYGIFLLMEGLRFGGAIDLFGEAYNATLFYVLI